VSKNIDCEFGQIPELVNEAIGLILPGGEEGLGEGGVLAGPEMDGGPVDAGVWAAAVMDWPAIRAWITCC